MLKQVLFIFGALFLFFAKAENVEIQENSNIHLSKSFTAHCQTAETCNYVFSATTSGQFFVTTFSIYVNSTVVSTGSYVVTTSEPVIISFPVTDGSKISIIFDLMDKESSDMLFALHDNVGNVVANSKQLEFPVLNPCQSDTCNLLFLGTAKDWSSNLAAKLYINGTVAVEFNITTPIANYFDIKPYDILDIKIVHDPKTPAIPNGLAFSLIFGETQIAVWYSNVYYAPFIYNSASCSNRPPPIPTGSFRRSLVSHNTRGNQRVFGPNRYFIFYLVVS